VNGKGSLKVVCLAAALAVITLGAGFGFPRSANADFPGPEQAKTKYSHADRQAAAERAKSIGMPAVAPLATSTTTSPFMVRTMGISGPMAAAPLVLAPNTVPHYYGPYPNYANSPLRISNAVIAFIGDGAGAAATATVDLATGAITAITVTNGGAGYTSPPTVDIASTGTGTGATATATITAGAVSSVTVVTPGSGYVTTGLRKFVDNVALLGPTGVNNLGQYIPVAVADTTTYPGTDYYEIALVEHQEQMHSDLPPTTVREYVQLSTGIVPGAQIPLTYPGGSPILINGQPALAVDNPHYLGPAIVAVKNRPVRILFRNLLPAGQAGDLFVPVDVTVMGSGMGPDLGGTPEPDPQRPMCGETPKNPGCFTENRATLHLHGGISPWISDGTPHQWVAPADDNTAYPQGVSAQNVPDMPDPGPGALTFFWTNQQSARLMFYHDHAWGITRLNVYVGEAAAYLITDPTEQALIDQGIIPVDQIPLVIQEKTFVPDNTQLAVEDPTWDVARWGGLGGLWLPHVYVPAQNPGDSSGVNQFGRWAYGPWFWPPTSNIDHPPIANPYYCGPDGLDANGQPCAPACDSDVQWCEPPLIPGTPYLSMGMEAFNDTPVVNGTAYPTITVDPKAYRMRILNAANDRFWNLHLYRAVDNNDVLCNAANPSPAPGPSGIACTEVRLNPAEVAAALTDPAGVFPTPDPATAGPNWVQIGTEGGFLPAPVVIPPQPITWVTDPTVFNAGNVDRHSLLLGPAERADVIVDFSAYAGQTLILYNDAPAAFPARDPRYDYYTGNANLTDTGGAPSTPPGFGPNIRTIMQIHVADIAPAASFDKTALDNAFKAASLGGGGVFESGQNPIIVGQGAYNSAYGSTFRNTAPRDGFVRITDTTFTFNTLLGQGPGQTMTMPLQPKAIHDEMGAAFDMEYGRMSGNLGLTAPITQPGAANFILYPYINPASEILTGIELPMGTIEATPITDNTDGTQIWKITHNGVDTHPIHWHLYDVQLINRVGWDGIIRKPDANELGWKDTVRISPLEDTIVAMRPIVPKIPFGVPDSVRPLNPMMPLGSTAGFNNTDANGNPIDPPITNQMVNFDWEYVWHCHILSHEEMDMMRPQSVFVSRQLPGAPTNPTSALAGTQILLTWTDNTAANYLDPAFWGDPSNEIGFRIDRSVNGGAFDNNFGAALANATSYLDTSVSPSTTYTYRVTAFNEAGDSVPSNTTAPITTLGVTLDALPASPQPAGTNPVTWTATPSGGVSPEYRFYMWNGSSYVVVQDYGDPAGANYNWDTSALSPGTYYFIVYARSAGSTAEVEAWAFSSYVLQ